MRAAALLAAPGRPVVVDVQVADPGPCDVIVRVAAAALCHSDLSAVDAELRHPVPVVLGHEAAGVVEAVGPEVSEVAVGDHVVACVSAFCGHCRYCLGGQPYLCARPPRAGAAPPLTLRESGVPIRSFFGIGAFAEQLIVHERALAVVPHEMPLDRAALLGCSTLTGTGAVLNGRIGPGSTVAVFGCGGVGLNCIQAAVLAGASVVVAVDVRRDKLDLAIRLGATHAVSTAPGDPSAAVREIVRGGVDVAIEAAGRGDTVRAAVASTRSGGTVTLLGMQPAGAALDVPFEQVVVMGKTIQGSVMGSNRFRLDIPRLAEMYLRGSLQLDPLVSRRVALDGLGDAMDALREGTVTRCLVMFPDTP